MMVVESKVELVRGICFDQGGPAWSWIPHCDSQLEKLMGFHRGSLEILNPVLKNDFDDLWRMHWMLDQEHS